MSEMYNEQGIKVCCENCAWWVEFKICEGWPCKLTDSSAEKNQFIPSDEAYCARIAELTTFVEEVTKFGESEGLVLSISEDARALLRGKSAEGK